MSVSFVARQAGVSLSQLFARKSQMLEGGHVESAGKMEAAQFLRDFTEAVPYRIHTVLTDNSIQFTSRQQDRGGSVYLNSDQGLDKWISCQVQAAAGRGSLSK